MSTKINKTNSFAPNGTLFNFLKKRANELDNSDLSKNTGNEIFERLNVRMRDLRKFLTSLTPSDEDYSEALGEGVYYDLNEDFIDLLENTEKLLIEAEGDPKSAQMHDAFTDFRDDASILTEAFDLAEKNEIDNLLMDIEEIIKLTDINEQEDLGDKTLSNSYSDWRSLLTGPNELRNQTLSPYGLDVEHFTKHIYGTPTNDEVIAHKSAKKLISDIIKFGRDREVLMESDTYDWVKKIREISGRTFSKPTGDFGNFDMFFDYFSTKPKTFGGADYGDDQIIDEQTFQINPHLDASEQISGDYQNTVGTGDTGLASDKNTLRIDQLYQKYPKELHALINDIDQAINLPERATSIAKEFQVTDMSKNPFVSKIALKEVGNTEMFLSSLGMSDKKSKYDPILFNIKANQKKLIESNWKDLGALKRIVRDFEIIADDTKNSNSTFSNDVFHAKTNLLKNNWFVFVSSLDNFLENAEKILSYMKSSLDAPASAGGERIKRKERGFSADEDTIDEINKKYKLMIGIYDKLISNPDYMRDPESRGEISNFIGQFKILAEELFDMIYGISTSKELIVSGEEFNANQKDKKIGIRGRITRLVMDMAKNMKIIEIYDKNIAFPMLKSAKNKNNMSKKSSNKIKYCRVYRGI